MNGGIIIVPGNPVSINMAWRQGGRGRVYMGWEAQAWKNTVAYSAKIDWKKRPMIRGRVRIVMRAFFESGRTRDIDNVPKLALDALQGIVFLNDSQIDDLRIVRKRDKKKPRLEIEVEEIEEEILKKRP